MRVARFMTAAGLAWLMAITMSVSPTAQTKTDEDFDKLMKGVGGTVGAIRKGAEGGMMDQVAADATKMAGLFKDAQAFWADRKNTEAADWSKGAMDAALAIEKAATAKDAAAVGAATKTMMGACATCHGKYRDKAADGTYTIKKM
jgi:cytochrome c556